MPTTRGATITRVVILVVVALVIDIYAAARMGDGATISEVTLGFSLRHPALPFAVGVLCGHLFWNQQPPKEKS